ncbi:MAG: hypothetical protein N2260_08545 [Syntrophobacterales bacterium]|nr:hypothetical protein [Syntrophobacterales bacterium]
MMLLHKGFIVSSRSGQRNLIQQLLFVVLIILFSNVFSQVLLAEALFVHTVERKTLLGERTEKISTAYHRDGISIDRRKLYTGSFMRLFFGGIKEERQTVFISIRNHHIREIDWKEEKAYLYDINRLKEVAMLTDEPSSRHHVPIVEDRYQEFPPELVISSLEGEDSINGYRCRKVEVQLKLNTYDRLRGTYSKTDISQRLWLSEEVPGIEERGEVIKRLGDLIGVEVERLGALSFILSYWKGSLAPIAKDIEKVRGYPVKTHVIVTAHFIPPEGESKKVSRVINEETNTLVAVYNRIDEKLFEVPSHFVEVKVK